MNETIKDAILLFYILSFFSGVVNITLNSIFINKYNKAVYIRLLFFNIAFFIYLAVNFALFFSRLFNQAESMCHMIYSVFDLSYMFFLCLWIVYLDAFVESNKSRILINIISLSGAIYVALWGLVYSFYLDASDKVQGVAGKTMSASAEIIILIAALGCTLFYVIRVLNNRDIKKSRYLCTISIFMVIYFIWFFVYDLDVIFKFMGPTKWLIYPFDAVILLYLLINIFIIGFNYKKLWIKFEADDNILMDENMMSFLKPSIDEAVNKFRLAPREKEILTLILYQKNNAEIVNELSISSYTLKRHINNLFKKADVKSRAELIRLIKVNH